MFLLAKLHKDNKEIHNDKHTRHALYTVNEKKYKSVTECVTFMRPPKIKKPDFGGFEKNMFLFYRHVV